MKPVSVVLAFVLVPVLILSQAACGAERGAATTDAGGLPPATPLTPSCDPTMGIRHGASLEQVSRLLSTDATKVEGPAAALLDETHKVETHTMLCGLASSAGVWFNDQGVVTRIGFAFDARGSEADMRFRSLLQSLTQTYGNPDTTKTKMLGDKEPSRYSTWYRQNRVIGLSYEQALDEPAWVMVTVKYL